MQNLYKFLENHAVLSCHGQTITIFQSARETFIIGLNHITGALRMVESDRIVIFISLLMTQFD